MMRSLIFEVWREESIHPTTAALLGYDRARLRSLL
jgi:hypothetical protein